MDLSIRGKTALVTGAGRGLGRSISMCLANEGVSIVGISRTKDDLEELMRDLPRDEVAEEHTYHCADLTSPSGPDELMRFLAEREISPDIVVHNLGGNLNITNPFCSLEEWRTVMRINVEIPIELNRIFIPKMQKMGWGRVCHVSSISGLENQGPPSYCAAKAALVAYTRSLGRYVAKDGVVVNTILPGPVFVNGGYWDITSKTRPEHVEKFINERVAIQRLGEPDEIGKVVAFLCSQLSSFCVGSAFLVDGGQGRVFFSQEN